MKIRLIVLLAILLNVLALLFVALFLGRYEFYSNQDGTSGIKLNKLTGTMEYCAVKGSDGTFKVLCGKYK
jgi:hypothetical protein